MVLLLPSINRAGLMTRSANYQVICVSSCLGKLFCSFFEPTTPRTCHVFQYTSQISNCFFLPNNRTTDRVFTLRTLILDKYVYNHKEKIYARFVDFKKVFDSVWHVGLLHKLFQILPSYLWTFWSMNWWTHLIPVYNSWNLFQLALIFATNY